MRFFVRYHIPTQTFCSYVSHWYNRNRTKSIYTKWYPELVRYCPNTPIVVVGTKRDLLEDRRRSSSFYVESGNCVPLTREDGVRLCKDISAVKYVECSAETGKGLEHVFTEAARVSLSVKTPTPTSKSLRR